MPSIEVSLSFPERLAGVYYTWPEAFLAGMLFGIILGSVTSVYFFARYDFTPADIIREWKELRRQSRGD